MKSILKVLAIIIISIIALVVAGLVLLFSWSSVSSKNETLATENLCGGSVVLESTVYHGGFDQGNVYTVNALYVNNGTTNNIFSIGQMKYSGYGTGGYIPLPINTSIPTVVAEAPVFYQDPPQRLINEFIDPAEVSRAEFDAVATCLQTNVGVINDLLAKTPNINGQIAGQYAPHFGGMAYIRLDGLTDLVTSVNTNSPTNGQSGESPMVNTVGDVIYGSSLVGDIFNGLPNKQEFEAIGVGPYDSFIENKNSQGENIGQYVARLQQELKTR